MLSTEERDALNRGGVRGVIEQRAEATDARLAALESHVTPIPRMDGDIENLKKGASDTRARLASLEWETKRMDILTRGHEDALNSHAKVIARLMSATVQLFPKEDAPDLLSFLRTCDGALDCSPDGEMRIIFPEGVAVPLSDLMTATSLLRAHDPEGIVDVSYGGGIVVRLRSSSKGARA